MKRSDKTGGRRRDRLRFNGKLTSPQHQCENKNLPEYSWFLGDYRTYGNLFFTPGLGYGSRKSIGDRNSPQVQKHLKHITRLTAFKDIFLTSKHPQPPLPVSHTHFLHSRLLLNQDQRSIINMTQKTSSDKTLLASIAIRK